MRSRLLACAATLASLVFACGSTKSDATNGSSSGGPGGPGGPGSDPDGGPGGIGLEGGAPPPGSFNVTFGPLVTLPDPYDPDDPLAAARFADEMRASVRTLLEDAQ